MRLLSDANAPLGWSLGLVRMPALAAAQGLLRWRQEHAGPTALRHCRTEGVADVMGPLDIVATRSIVVQTDVAGWTMYMSNMFMGGDLQAIHGFHSISNADAVGLVVVPDVPGRLYGCTHVGVFRHGVHRAIYCGNDGGKWKFMRTGPPIQEEDPIARRGPIRDKFNFADAFALVGRVLRGTFPCEVAEEGYLLECAYSEWQHQPISRTAWQAQHLAPGVVGPYGGYGGA